MNTNQPQVSFRRSSVGRTELLTAKLKVANIGVSRVSMDAKQLQIRPDVKRIRFAAVTYRTNCSLKMY